MKKFNRDIDWEITQWDENPNFASKNFVEQKVQNFFEYEGIPFNELNTTTFSNDLKLTKYENPPVVTTGTIGRYKISTDVANFIGMPKVVGDGRYAPTKLVKKIKNDLEEYKR